MSQSTPPRADELEVSIIGPGRGECVLVHMADNEWCVVDSCVARGHKQPVAVEYLSAFNNNALDGVRLIVATHWHDDHVRGLARILKQSPNARFCCSQALKADQFVTLVETARSAIQGRSGVDVFGEIFDVLIGRAPEGKGKQLATPQWAIEKRELLRLVREPRRFSAVVTALSPSDGTVTVALANLARLLPGVGEAQRRITNVTPNKTSVVLWIEVGERRLLLGADLEHTDQAGEGWMAVLACHDAAEGAAIFKVPHHGSRNADCPDVWPKMLASNPIAILTPFSGGKRLPQNADLNRLARRTSELYCTARPAPKPRARSSMVEKKARQVAKERHIVDGSPGHVRIRWSLSDRLAKPVVELFSGAYDVNRDSTAA